VIGTNPQEIPKTSLGKLEDTPFLKLTCPLKTAGWKTIFPFEKGPFFKGHVNFPGVYIPKNWFIATFPPEMFPLQCGSKSSVHGGGFHGDLSHGIGIKSLQKSATQQTADRVTWDCRIQMSHTW